MIRLDDRHPAAHDDAMTEPCTSPAGVWPETLMRVPDAKTQWWFYAGHVTNEQGRTFAFHVAFFRHNPRRDRIGRWLPMRLLGPVMHFGQFGLTDLASGRYHWSHERSYNGDAGAAADHYHVWIRNWSVTGTESSHVLTAGNESVKIELEFEPQKPVVRHGRSGLVSKDSQQSNYHFSCPRMTAHGCITLGGVPHIVTGEAWMDREHGAWHPSDEFTGWDWSALHFDDGSELMWYVLRDRHGSANHHSYLTHINASHAVEQVGADGFHLRPNGTWRSPRTEIAYPHGWHLDLPTLDGALDIEPVMACQEIDTRGSTMVIYWEGAVRAHGRIAGRPVDGRGHVELVGYDQSHHRLTIFDWLRNEWRYRRGGSGGVLNDALAIQP